MKTKLLLSTFILALPVSLFALVNPRVQPETFFRSYNDVVLGEVVEKDSESRTLRLRVKGVAKSDVPDDRVYTLEASEAEEFFFGIGEEARLVVFAGRNGPRAIRNNILIYSGSGVWFRGKIGETAETLVIEGSADEGKSDADLMFGVYNGTVDLLWRMCRELEAGTAYFPSVPIIQFSGRKLAALESAPLALAVADVNRDGTSDLLVATDAAVGMLTGKGKGDFEDPKWVLDHEPGEPQSLSVDVQSDRLWVLHNAVLYEVGEEKWTEVSAFEVENAVVQSRFADINGDGKSDVVLSVEQGGLRVFLQKADGSFEDKTEDMNLTDELAAPEGTGRFQITDWNRDGKTDVIYLEGPGLILVQGEAGFAPVPMGMEDSYEFRDVATGSLVTPGVTAALVSIPDAHMLLEYEEGEFMPRDLLPFGNEVRETSGSMGPAVMADLNVDGYPDLFALSTEDGGSVWFKANRGYGSFMMSTKYGSDLFPKEINDPATSLVVEDVNLDGAPDLMVGQQHGGLWLFENRTLENRPDEVDPRSAVSSEVKQVGAKIRRVTPRAIPGTAGAWLRVVDPESDKLIWDERLSSDGPMAWTVVLRESGTYRFEIHRSTGDTSTFTVPLESDAPRFDLLEEPTP